LDYSAHDLLAVRESDPQYNFWVAEVITIAESTAHGVVSKLKVKSYEIYKGKEHPYIAMYAVSMEQVKGKRIPFIKFISVDTVLVKFSFLKKDRRISVNDAKSTRTALGVHQSLKTEEEVYFAEIVPG